MSKFAIKLDVDKNTLPMSAVNVRVGDKGSCTIVADISSDGVPMDLTGYTARFEAAKPDKTMVRDAACTVSGSKITYTLAPSVAAVPGTIAVAYFALLKGSTIVETTENIAIRVLQSAESAGNGVSKDYLSEVDDLLARLNTQKAAYDKAEAARVSAEAKRATDSAAATTAANNAANDARQVIAQLPLPSGNILRGQAEGPLCHVEDAFPSPLLGVRVDGTTAQNLYPVLADLNRNGLALRYDGGACSIVGTATAGVWWYTDTYLLSPGATYTLSYIGSPSVTVSIEFYSADNVRVGTSSAVSSPHTFVVPTGAAYARPVITPKINTAVNVKVYPMLVAGSHPAAWSPPGLSSVSECAVATHSKNLLHVTGVLTRPNGGYIIDSVSTTNLNNAPPGTYTVSLKMVDHNSTAKTFAIYVRDIYGKDVTAKSFTAKTGSFTHTFTSATTLLGMYAYVNDAATMSDVQVERGDVPTAYVLYGGARVPIDLKGNTLCSLPDGTRDELEVDAAGNVVLVKRTANATFSSESVVSGSASIGIHKRVTVALAILTPPTTANLFCDELEPLASWADDIPHCYVAGYTAYLFIPSGDGVAAAKAWLGSNPVSAVIPLATPQRIPVGTIAMPALPESIANVWPDTNITTTAGITYHRDINIALEQLAAAVVASV